jgi:hypothetical protein
MQFWHRDVPIYARIPWRDDVLIWKSLPQGIEMPDVLGQVAGTVNKRKFLGINLRRSGITTVVSLPHWTLVLCSLILTTVPWITRQLRFSLRTLLVGMTIVAISLGWAIYMHRQ